MWRILDEELLAGVSAAELHLRPARHARLLDADDYEAACAEVELVCQLWGGMADLLVPVNGDGTPDPYPTLLRHADVDAALGRNASQLVPGLSSARLRRAPALLAAAAEERTSFSSWRCVPSRRRILGTWGTSRHWGSCPRLPTGGPCRI